MITAALRRDFVETGVLVLDDASLPCVCVVVLESQRRLGGHSEAIVAAHDPQRSELIVLLAA